MAALTKRRNVIILIVAILVAVILFSSFTYLNSQKTYNGNVESVTIGVLPQEINSLIYIADNQHYFASQGLNVTIKPYSSNLAAVNDMLNGKLDFATASEFVLATEVLANQNIRAIATIDKNTQISIVALKDKGIENISDLAGKKIGVFLNGVVEFYLGQFLELNGMNINQVTLVDYSSLNVTSALASGVFDAAIVGRTTLDSIEQSFSSNSIVEWPAQNSQPTYYNAYCTQTFTVAHPDLINRFLKALFQAENYAIDNPEGAKVIIQKQLNISDAAISEIWPQNLFSLSLDQSFVLQLQEEARWLISNNLTDATVVPNFLNYIYVTGLETASPGAVDIIS